MSTSSIKSQIRGFPVVVVQWTSKKCTKKRDGKCRAVVLIIKPIVFFEVVVVVVVVVA